jgi:hypothetical protein
LVTVDKHVNNIQVTARQQPITVEELLEAVFSVWSALRLYSEDTPGRLRAVQLSEVK